MCVELFAGRRHGIFKISLKAFSFVQSQTCRIRMLVGVKNVWFSMNKDLIVLLMYLLCLFGHVYNAKTTAKFKKKSHHKTGCMVISQEAYCATPLDRFTLLISLTQIQKHQKHFQGFPWSSILVRAQHHPHRH